MEEIVGEGVLVIGANEHSTPVVLAITRRGPGGAAIKLVVRDGHAT